MANNNHMGFVVKPIAAGRAGIHAAPFIADALNERSISVMNFWAVDHDLTQIAELTADRGTDIQWKPRHLKTRGYEDGIKNARDELKFDPSFLPLDRPEDFSPNNRPSVIRCATFAHADTLWKELLVELRENTSALSQNLVLLFVFNPDGPTSGSATLELARQFRSRIRNSTGDLDEAILNRFSNKWVIGLELCTPDPGRQGSFRNTICGYVRRTELFELMKDHEKRPFDLLLTVDGKPPSLHGDVSYDSLDHQAGDMIASLLDSSLTDQDPVDIIRDNLLALNQCKLFGFRIGFHSDEVDELTKAYNEMKSWTRYVPVLKGMRRHIYQRLMTEFEMSTREPFRVAPPMTDQIIESMLAQSPFSSAMADLTKDELREDLYDYLVDYHLNCINAAAEHRFEGLFFYMKGSATDNKAFTPDPVRLTKLLVPDRNGYEGRSDDRIQVDHKDDDSMYSGIDLLGAAGPLVFENLGNFKHYKDAFDRATQHPIGQNDIKECIAFPDIWPASLWSPENK